MAELRRSLGFRDAASLVVGTIIGTGVFLKATPMAAAVGSPLAVLAALFAAGALSFFGALAYAELGAMFPSAGGEYVYLREAWGPPFGFLYGWTRFWIGTPGSIASYATGAAIFAGEGLVPIEGDLARKVTACALILVFTVINCLTVAFGGRVQSIMTAMKIVLIVGLAALVFGGAPGDFARLGQGTGVWTVSAFGAAMISGLWATDGWNNLPMAAGEVRDPTRVIPRALVVGMLIVMSLYALVFVAYFYALPVGDIVKSKSVATEAAITVLGSTGVAVMSAAFVLSALGAMNGSILTSARVPYAMASDGLFFRQLARVSPRTHVPVVAVIVQGVWACVLASTGSFDQLTDMVVFASWVFYALATAGVIVLRRRLPDAPRAFKVPGYPWLPVLFIVTATALLVDTVWLQPARSAIGLGFIAAGFPAYLLFRRAKR
ncbi:MAG TPA: amino acid permease [Kofleriaceae bacterium]|nr:amino acid permease [Kofleriaceae bacterium]